MSKYRVTSKMVLSDTRKGPLRIVWEAHEKALALFSVRERNAILKDCAKYMGDYWIANWLPKRFTNYAKTLGYHVGMKYNKSKTKQMGEAIPLTYTGSFREAALKGASAKGQSGTSEGPSVIIRIPSGDHQLASIVQEVMGKMPDYEVKAMATEFGKRLTALISESNTDDSTKSRLTGTQKLGLGIASRRAVRQARSAAILSRIQRRAG